MPLLMGNVILHISQKIVYVFMYLSQNENLQRVLKTHKHNTGAQPHLPLPKISKHCIAILTFAETFKE